MLWKNIYDKELHEVKMFWWFLNFFFKFLFGFIEIKTFLLIPEYKETPDKNHQRYM